VKSTIDIARCEALAARAIGGDHEARQDLVQHLWPFWIETVRSSRSMGSLARSEDAVHNVVMSLIEKIGKPDTRALRLYTDWRARHPDKDFGDWMRIVTKNAVRDYVRDQLGPPAAPGDVSVKRLLNEFASSSILDDHGVRPPFTAAQTARELLEFARSRLPVDQVRVLAAWLEGAQFEDIAADTGQTPEAARRAMRAAVATLRRHFGGSDSGSDAG
jgi:DNA-directed RNA polymerase specialized sigma24 family protein